MKKNKKYTVRELKTSEMNAWDKFIDQSPSGTLFNTADWLTRNARLFNKNCVRIFGVFNGDRLDAGLAAYVRARGPLQIVASPIMSFYHSIALTGCSDLSQYRQTLNQHAMLEVLIPFLENSFDSIELTLEPSIADIRPFLWRRWKSKVSYTYRVSLASDDIIWNSFNQNIRRMVRKAERLGLTVAPHRDIQAITHLLQLVFNKQNLPFQISYEKMIGLLSNIFEMKNVVSLGAFDSGGNLVAIDIALLDGKRAYMFLSASDPNRRKMGGTAFLRWHHFRHLRQYVDEVDLTGADIPAIAAFKSSMGGQLIPYYRVKSHTSWKGKLAMAVYERI